MGRLIREDGSVVVENKDIVFDRYQGGWVVGVTPNATIFTDPERLLVLVPDAPVLSPIQFKLCFTAEERLEIDEARVSDPVIRDAFIILDDPRLTGVDLNLPSTIGLIDYLVSKELLTPERGEQVKAGVML